METLAIGTGIVPGQAAPDKGDENAIVVFAFKAVQNKFKSEQEGRPIFEEHPFITINFPGDRTTEVHRKVRDSDMQRWPRQYEAFISGHEMPAEGTPIEEYPLINGARRAEFKALKIRTVEDLAHLSDGVLQNFGPGTREEVVKARNWLAAASDTGVMEALRTENDALREELGDMEGRLLALESAGRPQTAPLAAPAPAPATPTSAEPEPIPAGYAPATGADGAAPTAAPLPAQAKKDEGKLVDLGRSPDAAA